MTNPNDLLPVELRRSLPREVRLTKLGRTMAVFSALLVVGAIGVLWALAAQRGSAARKAASLEQRGIRVPAVVVETGWTPGDDRKPYAIYLYEAGDREQRGRVTLRRRDQKRVGDALEVRYLADDPGHSWMLGYEPSGPPVAAMVAAPLSLAFGGVMFGWSVQRQRQLLAEGRAAQARAVEVKKRWIRSEGQKPYRVWYEFETLSGAKQKVRLDARKKAQVGTAVTLIYDRENPRRCAVYPLPMVRVVV
jgi:hypothetical protein